MTRPSLGAARVSPPRPCGRLLTLALLLPLSACTSDRKPVIVLAAASLTRALADLEEKLEQERKDLDLQLEISGSQLACRKVSELNRRADVVASADHDVIDRLLRPGGHARFTIRFATNEVVLAHMAHSKFTEEITADNWPAVLQRPGVRLGLVDPDQAPIGYRTLLVWRLAGREPGLRRAGGAGGGSDLAARLRARVARENVLPHEAELLQQLQARAIDYAFVYRSTAEEHNLKLTGLPDRYNLGDAGQAASYATESVEVQLGRGEEKTIRGGPVVYGLTIPEQAPNRAGAVATVAYLLGAQGRRILERTGFRPLTPAICPERARLPAALRALTRAR